MQNDNLDKLILKAAPARIEPSPDFETHFWQKMRKRESASQWARAFEWIPIPSFAQAAAVLLVAVLIGGAGGVVSAMNAPETKGISSASVASNYLKLIELENLK